MKRPLFKILIFFTWVILVFILKNFTVLAAVLYGKGLFFALWFSFVFIFELPYQISVFLGVFLLLFFPLFYFFAEIGQGERIVTYAWGFLMAALLQQIYHVLHK